MGYKDNKFHNKSLKSCLQDKDTEMHSTHNKRKSAVPERIARVLNHKIYKYMTSV